MIENLGRWVRNEWDRCLAVVLVIAGLVIVYAGWRGVSGHLLPSEQLPYLASYGILGLFLLGTAATLWLSADMRDEWRKLDAVVDELRAVNERSGMTPAEGP